MSFVWQLQSPYGGRASCPGEVSLSQGVPSPTTNQNYSHHVPHDEAFHYYHHLPMLGSSSRLAVRCLPIGPQRPSCDLLQSQRGTPGLAIRSTPDAARGAALCQAQNPIPHQRLQLRLHYHRGRQPWGSPALSAFQFGNILTQFPFRRWHLPSKPRVHTC